MHIICPIYVACDTYKCVCHVQILMQIQDSVHLLQSVTYVIRLPPAFRLHLLYVPVTQPAATGVNAFQDIHLEMD